MKIFTFTENQREIISMKAITIVFILAFVIGATSQIFANDKNSSKNQTSCVSKSGEKSNKAKISDIHYPADNPCISAGDPKCSCYLDLMGGDPEFPWELFVCKPPFYGFNGCYSSAECNIR